MLSVSIDLIKENSFTLKKKKKKQEADNIPRNYYECRVHRWPSSSFAQLAGPVEYTDYFSAEGQDPPQTCVLDMTLNNLMMRFQ